MPWVRYGDCPPERCKGRCCRHVGVFFEEPPWTPFLELLAVRGARVLTGGGGCLVELPQRCQWLSSKGRCRLHPDMHPTRQMPARPRNCSEWPTHPDQLALDRDCGFSFEWVEEEQSTGA